MRSNWRPVRESNPGYRREGEALHCNSTELSGMDSTLPHLRELTGTLIGPLMDVRMGQCFSGLLFAETQTAFLEKASPVGSELAVEWTIRSGLWLIT